MCWRMAMCAMQRSAAPSAADLRAATYGSTAPAQAAAPAARSTSAGSSSVMRRPSCLCRRTAAQVRACLPACLQSGKPQPRNRQCQQHCIVPWLCLHRRTHAPCAHAAAWAADVPWTSGILYDAAKLAASIAAETSRITRLRANASLPLGAPACGGCRQSACTGAALLDAGEAVRVAAFVVAVWQAYKTA